MLLIFFINKNSNLKIIIFFLFKEKCMRLRRICKNANSIAYNTLLDNYNVYTINNLYMS